MTDWYLGQAGFQEQIQLYGDSFWRQTGSALFWSLLVIGALLVFAAVVVALSRRANVATKAGVAHKPGTALLVLRTGESGTAVPRAGPPRPTGVPPARNAA